MTILNYRKLNQFLTGLTSTACMVLCGLPVVADDTEIFFGRASSMPSSNPNMLLILDTSGSMSSAVDGDTRDRLKVVQDVANQLISTVNNVNIGIMRFDYDADDYPADSVSDGGMVVHRVADVGANRSTLQRQINRLHHAGATPLAETYLEAAQYFMGRNPVYGNTARARILDPKGKEKDVDLPSVADSIGSDGNYISPIMGACQRNFIIYLSDGLPTYDKNANDDIAALLKDTTYNAHTARDCVNGHGDTDGMCLDELAEFLHKNDFSPAPGVQNVTSHFIGFNASLPIFEDAAANGGGTYERANNADTLLTALTAIVDTVVETNDGFTAPAVTVNAFDRTAHLDQLFFTVFKPGDSDHWEGNLKKYRSAKSGEDLIIVDKNGNPAVDPRTGFFFDGKLPDGTIDARVPTAHSYWSATPDGADVTAGGAASILTLGRKIITNPGDGAPGPLAAHDIDNVDALSSLLASRWDGTIHDLTATEWLDWAAGIDVNDADEDGSTVDPRTQMGAALHSKPAVVVYGGSSSIPQVKVFVGTNEGYLHAFDGTTGQEHFAFMPKDLWGNIPALAENRQYKGNLPYGVDGHIVVHKNDGGDGTIDPGSSDFVHLIFGLRRGGNAYYSVDVTDINAPRMMWKFTTSGQSWSRPVVSQVNLGTTASPSPRTVVFLGGGYDPRQDSQTTYSADTVGNAVHMIDAATGVELWKASSTADADLQLPDMVNSIPSAIRPLDMNLDGFVDRLYVNDIAGRLFRIDVHHDGPTHRVTGGVIASVGGATGGASAANRRFYYAPDIALGSQDGQHFLTISMASGFRAHPLNKSIQDYLIGVRDYAPFNPLGVDPLTAEEDYDYGTLISNMHNIGASSPVPAGAKGWYRALSSDSGEKSLARSRIFQNKAYFTTYTPGSAPSSNPCAPALGTGKLVVIDLKTGATTETVLQKPGIPPEVSFVFGEDTSGTTEEFDYCFGTDCDTSTTGPDDLAGPSDPDPDPEGSGRDVQCLAGPESCDADSGEAPQRTFWRQSSTE